MKEIASIDKKKIERYKNQFFQVFYIIHSFYWHRVIIIEYFKGEKFNLGEVNECLKDISIESIFRNFYEKRKR